MDYHAFAVGDRAFLFFPRSARLFEVEPDVCSMLKSCDMTAFRPRVPSSSSRATGSLWAEFSELLAEERGIAFPPLPARGEETSRLLRSVSIWVSQTCNMACIYCWNHGGTFGGPDHIMDLRTARLVAENVAELMARSEQDRIIVTYYGGEPLLNFEAVKYVTLHLLKVSRTLEKTIVFTLDTNGCHLSGEKAEFLAKYFGEVGVSVDGSQAVHDLQRPSRNGLGTYRRIASNLTSFPRPDILKLRGTLTRFSESYSETFWRLSSWGIRRVQLEYCVPIGRRTGREDDLDVPLERRRGELIDFAERYVHLISRVNRSEEVQSVSNLLSRVQSIWSGKRHTRPCGAGINMLFY